MTAQIQIEIEGDIAVITIDNPPINAGSTAVRRGLLDAIADVRSQDALVGAVIIGAGSTFIAGSDLREFGQPLDEPQLPAVITAIEHCGKPVVAALHGAALGGGYELALGCDGRVAMPGTVVGLPEVTLGIIPGAGGTQRLPRLVGVAEAIRLICSGERVSAEKALKLGMIDEIATGDLRAAAIAFARRLEGRKRLVRTLSVPSASGADAEEASRLALKAGRGRPGVHAAIKAVRDAISLPFEEALAAERSVFQELRLSREAKALRHLFFAEREAGKHPALKGAEPRSIEKVAVIGAGTMGAGIAIAALDAGYRVTLVEREPSALARGNDQITDYYGGRIAVGKLDEGKAQQRLQSLTASCDWNMLADADLVIEAVFEDIEVKKDVFRQLDRIMRPGAVLASNTSYLDLDTIAAATERPADVLGLHFFSPANVMRLLEVVRGEKTSADVLATGLAVGKRMRKLPILTGNAFGFIGNRIYSAYRRQCEFLIEEGAWPEQVDAALEAFGFAMGPFAVADMSGLDIAWRMRKAQAPNRNPADRYVHIPDMLCEAGRLGRKTGGGYYAYDAASKARAPAPLVHDLIAQARREKGIDPRQIQADEICRRALLSIVNEAALLLSEGVAERPGDVDLVLTNGYGFPRCEGGAVFFARERGLENLEADMDWLAEVSGPGFVRGKLESLWS